MGIFDRFRINGRGNPSTSISDAGISREDGGGATTGEGHPDNASTNAEWVILEWSRELARGKVFRAGGPTVPFDASIADVDDFRVGERVIVSLSYGRVTAVRHAVEHPADVGRLAVSVAPAGIFRFDEQSPAELRRLGESLQAASLGDGASLDLYPSFVCMSGWDTALGQGDSWRAFEVKLFAALDEHFGHAAKMNSLQQALIGDFEQVQAAVKTLEQHGPPTRSFARLFVIDAKAPVTWDEVSAERESNFQKGLGRLPFWVGWKDGLPHWFLDGNLAWPHLTAKRTVDGIHLTGVVNMADWEQWRSLFEPMLAGLPWMPH